MFTWPNLVIAELFVFVLTVAVILCVSLLFNAPLEEPVNIMHPPNPAKAPWYFLGLQEMVSYSAFWGGVGIPTVFVILLLLVPYLDRGAGGRRHMVRAGATAGEHALPHLRHPQPDPDHHRHLLPRTQLVVRLSVE